VHDDEFVCHPEVATAGVRSGIRITDNGRLYALINRLTGFGTRKGSIMKSLARPSFFRMFDLLLGTTNPGLKFTRWTHDGVEFERERHSFAGPRHSLTIEIFTLTRGGRRGWCLMVTKEYWWVGAEAKPFKNVRWARPLSGQRKDLFDWLLAQEAALERSSSFAHGSHSAIFGDTDVSAEVDEHEAWTEE
jgi:hypothetical protein